MKSHEYHNGFLRRWLHDEAEKTGRSLTMAHDVFVSHSHEDNLTADALCDALERNGVRCWIAPRDIQPGTDYGTEIMKGIKECAIFLLLFSDGSNNSVPVRKEVERAVLGYRKNVLQFRIENVPLSEGLEYYLGDIPWIDACGDIGGVRRLDAYPDEAVFADLIVAIKSMLGRETESAASAITDVSVQEPEYKKAESTAPVVDDVPAQEHKKKRFKLFQRKQKPARLKNETKTPAYRYNLTNGGHMLQSGSHVYYSKNDGILYKLPLCGDSNTRVELFRDVENKHIKCLNIQGETIYFYLANTGVCRIQTDGSGFALVKAAADIDKENASLLPKEMFVIDGSVFIRFKALYRFELDGGETQRVTGEREFCSGLTVYNGLLYFSLLSKSIHGSVARIKPDGTGREIIIENLEARSLLLDDQFIYYSAYDEILYRVRHGGSSKEQIGVDRGSEHFNMDDKWVYYDISYGRPQHTLHHFEKAGSQNEALPYHEYDDDFGIYLIDGWVYFKDLWKAVVRRIKPDGTGLEKMRM
jgi:hypothetical protein